MAQTRGRLSAEWLPELKAENEAWRREHLPKLREAQAEREARRHQAMDILRSRITNPGEKDIIMKVLGIAI